MGDHKVGAERREPEKGTEKRGGGSHFWLRGTRVNMQVGKVRVILPDVFMRHNTGSDMYQRLSSRSLESAFQTILTTGFPGTSQNVNAKRPGTTFCLLHLALLCPELGNCSEKINCECFMNMGRLLKMCREVDNPRSSIPLVYCWAFQCLKRVANSSNLVTFIFSHKRSPKIW